MQMHQSTTPALPGNNKTSIEQLEAFFKSDEFEAKLVRAYSSGLFVKQTPSLAKVQQMKRDLATAMWKQAREAQRQQRRGYTYLSVLSVPVHRLERIILLAAYHGLDLSPARRHVIFQVNVDAYGYTDLEMIIGVKGMHFIFAHSPKVKNATVNLVFDGDHFDYRGTDEKPLLRAGKKSFIGNATDIICGYFTIERPDGSVYCHLVRQAHLIKTAQDAKDGYLNLPEGTDQGIIDNATAALSADNPWFNEYETKMFEHIITRSAFRAACESEQLTSLTMDENLKVTGIQQDALENTDDDEDMDLVLRQFQESARRQGIEIEHPSTPEQFQ